jgi:1,2-phenylacetyl-CoA epoxidase catalytic subunit
MNIWVHNKLKRAVNFWWWVKGMMYEYENVVDNVTTVL